MIFIDINEFFKKEKEREDYENYVYNQVTKHMKIADRELSPKGKYSSGYYKTMEMLGGHIIKSNVSKEEKKERVNWIFYKKSWGKNIDPYTQGQLNAIRDFRIHQNKRNLNIYGEKIKKRK